MSDRINSFAPNISENCNRIVLGSMPGGESLRQQQYYAHPRNSFWKIMDELFGIPADLPYEKRLSEMLKHGIALWDSAHSCVRPGSLDSNIRDAVANDFESLFMQYVNIRKVFFNGKAAETLFRRHTKGMALPELEYISLPSTSPANAGMTFEQKLASWSMVVK